jgi:hypothetical protein
MNFCRPGVLALILVLSLPGTAVSEQPTIHCVPDSLSWHNPPVAWRSVEEARLRVHLANNT